MIKITIEAKDVEELQFHVSGLARIFKPAPDPHAPSPIATVKPEYASTENEAKMAGHLGALTRQELLDAGIEP